MAVLPRATLLLILAVLVDPLLAEHGNFFRPDNPPAQFPNPPATSADLERYMGLTSNVLSGPGATSGLKVYSTAGTIFPITLAIQRGNQSDMKNVFRMWQGPTADPHLAFTGCIYKPGPFVAVWKNTTADLCLCGGLAYTRDVASSVVAASVRAEEGNWAIVQPGSCAMGASCTGDSECSYNANYQAITDKKINDAAALAALQAAMPATAAIIAAEAKTAADAVDAARNANAAASAATATASFSANASIAADQASVDQASADSASAAKATNGAAVSAEKAADKAEADSAATRKVYDDTIILLNGFAPNALKKEFDEAIRKNGQKSVDAAVASAKAARASANAARASADRANAAADSAANAATALTAAAAATRQAAQKAAIAISSAAGRATANAATSASNASAAASAAGAASAASARAVNATNQASAEQASAETTAAAKTANDAAAAAKTAADKADDDLAVAQKAFDEAIIGIAPNILSNPFVVAARASGQASLDAIAAVARATRVSANSAQAAAEQANAAANSAATAATAYQSVKPGQFGNFSVLVGFVF